MLSTNISLSGDEVLCEYVAMEDFKGFLQQRIGIAPDTLTVLIRDGQVADTSHGAHISVGGMWQSVKESIGGSHALQLLIADAKPFDGSFPFQGQSRDGVVIEGEVTLQLQVDPQSGSNILGLASQHNITNKSAVYERLAPHLNDRALQSILGQVDATALRGAVDVQDKLQAEMLNVCEEVLGDMGIVVRASSVNWALNEAELIELEIRCKEREQALMDEKLTHYSRELERAEKSTILKIESDLEIEKVRALSEQDLRTLIASQEAEFVEVKESAIRAARVKALEGEINEFKIEQQAKFQNALGEAKNEVDVKKVELEITQLDLKTDDLVRRQEVALSKLEELTKLEIAEVARKNQVQSIRDLNQADLDMEKGRANVSDDSADRQTKRELEQAKHASMTELEKLKIQQGMSADQLLAMQAGMSASVAAVFAERAKTDQTSVAEQKQMMQQLIDSGAKTGEDAKYFFEQFKEGVIGVAAGAGPGASPAAAGTASETVVCPRCKNVNSGDREFCVNCRGALRA